MNLIKPLRIDVWKKFTQFSSQIHNTKESFSHIIGRTEPKKVLLCGIILNSTNFVRNHKCEKMRAFLRNILLN